jgi:hypothetical protein
MTQHTLTPLRSQPFNLTGELPAPPADPAERAAREDDVAHALSLLNRYTGHIPYPYSVAEHSTLAAKVWGRTPLERLAILLHDAHEAFMGDIATPVKAAMAETADFECVDHVRWYESNMEYRLRRYLGTQPEGSSWRSPHLMERVHQADKGIYLAEELVLRGRLVGALEAAQLEDDQRQLVQAAVSLLKGRQQRLERAHHALQLCFATDPPETRAAIADHAPPLGLPRAEVCFGWPAKGEYLAMLREARRETGL